jgi:predicted small lipoprotein YifL
MMKKPIALFLALCMALTLTACGGNGDTPSDRETTTPPPSSQGDNTPSPSDDGGNDTADGTLASSSPVQLASVDPKDEGKYFYTTSDDYMYSGVFDVMLPSGGEVKKSYVFSFEDGMCTNACYLEIYESAEAATENMGKLVSGWEPVAIATNNVTVYYTNAGDNFIGMTRQQVEDIDFAAGEDALDTSDTTPDSTDSGGDATPSVVIPDNGTPPTVTPPMENHEGDKGYFYVTTDNYVVAMRTGSREVDVVDKSGYAVRIGVGVDIYLVFSFEDGVCVNVCVKQVYENAEYATGGASTDDPAFLTIIENVAYFSGENTEYEYIGMDKENVLNILNSAGWEHIVDSANAE